MEKLKKLILAQILIMNTGSIFMFITYNETQDSKIFTICLLLIFYVFITLKVTNIIDRYKNIVTKTIQKIERNSKW